MRLYRVTLKYRIVTQYTQLYKATMMLTVGCMRIQAKRLYIQGYMRLPNYNVKAYTQSTRPYSSTHKSKYIHGATLMIDRLIQGYNETLHKST